MSEPAMTEGQLALAGELLRTHGGALGPVYLSALAARLLAEARRLEKGWQDEARRALAAEQEARTLRREKEDLVARATRRVRELEREVEDLARRLKLQERCPPHRFLPEAAGTAGFSRVCVTCGLRQTYPRGIWRPRCGRCAWPLADTLAGGCTEDLCCMRAK